MEERFRRVVRDRFGVRHSVPTSTGRAGLTLLLRAMRRLAPNRNEVILPSYTCYSVAASVVKAGLRPRLVDIDPDTLSYSPEDLERADFGQVLAIVATNLYGLPNDLPSLRRIADQHGVRLIDDAAQAMGASIAGRMSGTWGDAGLFSFDRGKNVSSIEGGLVVTSSDEIAEALETEMASLSRPTPMEAVSRIGLILAYFIFLRPWLYWIPNGIPQLELGRTEYTTAFPERRAHRWIVGLAALALGRLDEFTQARVSNARRILSGLGASHMARAVSLLPETDPVYLRLPLLARDSRVRDGLIATLNAAGIGATASYPASLADVPALHADLAEPLGRVAGGRHVAAHIVTLPTHPLTTAGDLERMVHALTRYPVLDATVAARTT
jgi:dTDP-4-amino-4,6-dideoxygalactose transaminase